MRVLSMASGLAGADGLRKGHIICTYKYIHVGRTSMSHRTKIFRSGNSEAVRIPRDMAFGEGTDVILVRSGDSLTIFPAPRLSMADLSERLSELPVPDEVEVRDAEMFPDRGGD